MNETDFLVAITWGSAASGSANYRNFMIGKANADAAAQRVGSEHVSEAREEFAERRVQGVLHFGAER